ncbi:MAG TPA: hypothetical protein DDZ89_21145, partial [Clostridiales bacterium]|nr:hypothetical protein [Clostridiales bacterium]
MLKLSKMILDNKKDSAQFLKKEADDALLLVLNGYETADLATLRTRILNYTSASNLYKVAQVEFDQLDKYYTETVEKKYDTEYTFIKDPNDKDDDDDDD